MTANQDAQPDTSSSEGPSSLPSAAALVGVWARAALTLWNLALEWWKVVPEGGYAEDRRQGVWSTTVYFPRRDHDITVELASVTTATAELVPDADVTVRPTFVERDVQQGNKELEVVVKRLPYALRNHFILTIRDCDDPSWARQYGLGFGVPGAAR